MAVLDQMAVRRVTPKSADSQWLGTVPADWDVVPLKRLAPFVSRGNSPEYSDEGVPVINQACIHWTGLKLENFKYQELADTTDWKGRLRRGDVLINSTGTGTLGRCIVFDRDEVMMADSHVTIVRTNSDRLDPVFLRLLMETDLYQGFVYSALTSGSTNQIELSREGLRAMHIVLPSLSQQQAIVRFLEKRCGQLDDTIRKKQRLIDLLAEEKSALITRTVTLGLDSKVPLKDSGIKSLGAVPAHWSVKPLMSLAQLRRPIMYGIVLPGPSVAEGVPIVKGGDVAPGRLTLERLNKTTLAIEANYARSRLKAGDLVYAIRGSIGAVEIVPPEIEGANLTQDAARIAPDSFVCRDWLLFSLRACAVFAQLESKALGATIRGINIRDLKRAQIPVPPLGEQEAIAHYLNAQTARMEGIASLTETQIRRLQEYRSALISAAVTGQIDVTTHHS
jgi:type I restriction enzyme S subunit